MEVILPYCRISLTTDSFIPSTIRKWNSLDKSVRNIDSLKQLKTELGNMDQHKLHIVPKHYLYVPRKLNWRKTDNTKAKKQGQKDKRTNNNLQNITLTDKDRATRTTLKTGELVYDLCVVPWHKHRPFAFGFHKVLMAGWLLLPNKVWETYCVCSVSSSYYYYSSSFFLFVCLYTYEFWLSLCKIARSSVILLLPLFLSFFLLSKVCQTHFSEMPSLTLMKPCRNIICHVKLCF